MNSNLLSNLKRFAGRSGLVLSKYSPEILMGVGIFGTVVATVLACKATLKLGMVMELTQEMIDEAKTNPVDKEDPESRTKAVATAYATRAGLLIRLYGPAVIISAASISCMVGSHKILSKRNIALVAAYKIVDEGFKRYRGGVVEEYGEEKDRELMTKIRMYDAATPSKGKPKDIPSSIMSLDPSIYARRFDESNPNWARNHDYNVFFLTSMQNWANDLLKAKGHVFLNEVYDYLGLTRTQAGQVVGWIYDKRGPIGDNFIDFGILSPENQMDLRLQVEVPNYNPPFELDFNVDGPILDMI